MTVSLIRVLEKTIFETLFRQNLDKSRFFQYLSLILYNFRSSIYSLNWISCRWDEVMILYLFKSKNRSKSQTWLISIDLLLLCKLHLRRIFIVEFIFFARKLCHRYLAVWLIRVLEKAVFETSFSQNLDKSHFFQYLSLIFTTSNHQFTT